jgi:hypothetical protein
MQTNKIIKVGFVVANFPNIFIAQSRTAKINKI